MAILGDILFIFKRTHFQIMWLVKYIKYIPSKYRLFDS